MIQAAIFDMDGLLIDSEPFWRAAHVKIVGEHGHKITPDDVRAMAGRRTDSVVAHWKERFGIDADPDKLEEQIVSEVVAEILTNGQTLPGVTHILELFKAHEIPMAVASSSAPHVIDAVLEKLDLQKYMQLAHSAKYEEFGKPHPAVFLSTAKQLDVAPASCVVFEDAISGVKAAKAAEMKCVAVPEAANRTRPEFQQADLIVDSLRDVGWSDIESLF